MKILIRKNEDACDAAYRVENKISGYLTNQIRDKRHGRINYDVGCSGTITRDIEIEITIRNK